MIVLSLFNTKLMKQISSLLNTKSYQRYIKDKYFKGYGCVCGRVMSNTFSDAVFLSRLSLTVRYLAIESIFYTLNSVIFYYNIF